MITRLIGLFALLFLCVPVPRGSAVTINVSPGQSIQSAIDSAVDGDTIEVNAGIYTENINFKGKQLLLRSIFGPDTTILDGNSSGPVVTFNSWEQRETVLEGFTIKNGSGAKINGLDYGHGGGILCIGSSPTIRMNIIELNKADPAGTGLFGLGGGICVVDNAYPLIDNNTIRNNRAESGGGIYIHKHYDPEEYGLPVIRVENSTITANTARLGGGLFICGNARPSLNNSIVTSNSASAGGPQIYSCSDFGYTLITLSSFKATAHAGSVTIFWSTASETANAGFNIYRSEGGGEYKQINAELIPAKGSPTQGAKYEYTDHDVKNRKTYWYKLEDVDFNGATTFHGPVSVTSRLVYGE